MTRVAFITDLHICRETRWEETLRIMDWVVDTCAEQRVDVIAGGGDWWDRKPDVGEVKVTAEWLVRLANIAPVVGVAGNHDADGISMLNLVSAAHPVHIVERPEVYAVAGIEFALLPWPRKAHLLERLPEAGREEARQIGVELLTNVLRGLGQRQSDAPSCFVGHVQICGAKVSTGQPLAPGADFELGTDDLALANCDAYLFGHIHLPDDMTVGGRPGVYGGSFRRTVFGEVEEKSLVIVDYRGHDAIITRVPIPCAPMFLATDEWQHTGTIDASSFAFVHGWNGLPEDEAQLRGAEIRLRYCVAPDQREAARAASEAMKAYLIERGAVDVKIDPQVVSATTARAPEVAEARTVPEKLRALWKLRGNTPDAAREARLLKKLSRLEAGRAV